MRGEPWYDGALGDSSPAEPKEEQLRSDARKLYSVAFDACAKALKGSQEHWRSTEINGSNRVHPGVIDGNGMEWT